MSVQPFLMPTPSATMDGGSPSRIARLAQPSWVLVGCRRASAVRRRKSDTIQILIIDSVELVWSMLAEPAYPRVSRSYIAHAKNPSTATLTGPALTTGAGGDGGAAEAGSGCGDGPRGGCRRAAKWCSAKGVAIATIASAISTITARRIGYGWRAGAGRSAPST